MDYISNETLRRRVQKGLNKGEAMNGLARAIFFGKRGELRERGLQEQLQRASALNIIINAINVWNTVYLTEATTVLKEKGIFREELMQIYRHWGGSISSVPVPSSLPIFPSEFPIIPTITSYIMEKSSTLLKIHRSYYSHVEKFENKFPQEVDSFIYRILVCELILRRI